MTTSLDASMFAGNQGISVKSEYGLWGTTTRKMKFRISSANAKMIGKDQNQVLVDLELPLMPNVKRATLVPESFSLSLNADPAKEIGGTNSGIVPTGFWGLTNTSNVVGYSQVCLRCSQLSQPYSFDNGCAGVNAVPATTATDHSSYMGRSNIIMSMPLLCGDGNFDGVDRLVQVFKNYSGNEYDCGMELTNDCFQVAQWKFSLTNEFGHYYSLGNNADDDSFIHSWYAEFSIVYEPEKTDFELN
jgi:hypothetical protein